MTDGRGRWALALAVIAVVVACAGGPVWAQGRASIASRVREPYKGAIVVDAETGAVLFEDRADELGYPASIVKLMDMLLIDHKIKQIQLQDQFTLGEF